jgi:hypothetical protein
MIPNQQQLCRPPPQRDRRVQDLTPTADSRALFRRVGSVRAPGRRKADPLFVRLTSAHRAHSACWRVPVSVSCDLPTERFSLTTPTPVAVREPGRLENGADIRFIQGMLGQGA